MLLDKILEMLYSDLVSIFDFLFRKITTIIFSSFITDFEVKESENLEFSTIFQRVNVTNRISDYFSILLILISFAKGGFASWVEERPSIEIESVSILCFGRLTFQLVPSFFPTTIF